MANDLSSRQWRLDTPVAFSTGSSSVLWWGNIFIKQVEFSGYAAQTNTCVLKDSNGKIVWSATGSTALDPVRLGDIGWVNGLVLDTLTAGLCVVYVK